MLRRPRSSTHREHPAQRDVEITYRRAKIPLARNRRAAGATRPDADSIRQDVLFDGEPDEIGRISQAQDLKVQYSLTIDQVPLRARLRRPHRFSSSPGLSPGVVTILLDENFPLRLVRVLEADGLHVDHIITLG